MNVVVLGAGISGRMFQNIIPASIVLESKSKEESKQMTFQSGTNYLWEPIPGFECDLVNVTTHVDGKPWTTENVRRYKSKIGKSCESTEGWERQFKLYSKGYALLNVCKERDVRYSCKVDEIDASKKFLRYVGGFFAYDYLVSTIPLRFILELTGLYKQYPMEQIFKYAPIYVKKEKIESRPGEIYVNYLSDFNNPCYRITERNGERHHESLAPLDRIDQKIIPGKIYPSPWVDKILGDLTARNIFCFGRFARWMPEELIHETYKDIVKWRGEQIGTV